MMTPPQSDTIKPQLLKTGKTKKENSNNENSENLISEARGYPIQLYNSGKRYI